MTGKRVTIYDLASELGISASYVSKALNNQPGVSKKIREQVFKKAAELNYKHNLHAANLRRGSAKTIGVVVPHINQSFFSDVIAGIEEACSENNYNLIICQSHDSYQKECKAIETLIHHNVNCILISISAETQNAEYLQEIRNHNIELIQFDRYLDAVDGYKVVNDNLQAAYKAVKSLISQGYKKIAFIGGPGYLKIFNDRKSGYLQAITEAALTVDDSFITENNLDSSTSDVLETALTLLSSSNPPDAFFTVSDHQALSVLKAAQQLNINVPQQLGVFGFANETFSQLTSPALSSVDQKSKELGYFAANLYFKKGGSNEAEDNSQEKIIETELIFRTSSLRNG